MPANLRTRGNCTFDGCDRPHFAKGYCRGHYSQQYKGKPLEPLGQRYARPIQVCTFDGCDHRRQSTTGLCEAHARQLKRGGELRPLGSYRIPRPCGFDGCDRQLACNGLCRAHDAQRRKGRPLTELGTYRRPKKIRAPRPGRKLRVVSTMPAGWDRPLPKPPAYRGSDKSAPKDVGPARPLTAEEVRAMRRVLQLMRQSDLAGMLGVGSESGRVAA